MTIKAIKIKIFPENNYAIDIVAQEFMIIENQEQPIGEIINYPLLYPGQSFNQDLPELPSTIYNLIDTIHTNDIILAYQSLSNPTLEQAKINKKQIIAQERYQYEISGVYYNNHLIRTDRTSVQVLDSYIEKMRRGLIESINWKCVDTWLLIDNTIVDAIEVSIISHIATAFMKEYQAKIDIDALETISAINAYNVEW